MNYKIEDLEGLVHRGSLLHLCCRHTNTFTESYIELCLKQGADINAMATCKRKGNEMKPLAFVTENHIYDWCPTLMDVLQNAGADPLPVLSSESLAHSARRWKKNSKIFDVYYILVSSMPIVERICSISSSARRVAWRKQESR